MQNSTLTPSELLTDTGISTFINDLPKMIAIAPLMGVECQRKAEETFGSGGYLKIKAMEFSPEAVSIYYREYYISRDDHKMVNKVFEHMAQRIGLEADAQTIQEKVLTNFISYHTKMVRLKTDQIRIRKDTYDDSDGSGSQYWLDYFAARWHYRQRVNEEVMDFTSDMPEEIPEKYRNLALCMIRYSVGQAVGDESGD